jgi:two-component system chemotaxis sensor kinase CheA
VGEHRYGLIVDEVHDNEEIVIKPLSKYVKKVKCYSGSAILGNGSVAMIMDTGGLSEMSQMSFSDIDIESNRLKEETEAKSMIEKQELLLFNTGGKERFAMNLDLVARVEKISVDQIEKVGDDEFIYFNEKSLKTIRLDNHLPVSPLVIPESNECYVIIPKLVKHPLGIICANLDDTLRTHVSLEKDNINSPGILGSAKIKDTMTLIVDIYSLFEKIAPDQYAKDVQESESLDGKKILFAEDTDFFRQVVGNFLRSHGAILTVANDGQEAWEHLAKGESFDALVTDIQMPRMDGFQLTQKIRTSSNCKDLPIMALTSMANQTYIDRGKEVGIDAYEIKLDKERQRQRLEELVSGKG